MPQLPPRQWTVRARFASPGPPELYVGEKQLSVLLDESGGAAPSPVEYLLLAVADCFALSLEIARKAGKLPACVFDVSCSGVKAAQAPGRLERICLNVSVSGLLKESQREQLVAEAKALCTVTNTLAQPPSIEIEPVG
jgi:uncharacterized OsmC-like protein